MLGKNLLNFINEIDLNGAYDEPNRKIEIKILLKCHIYYNNRETSGTK